MKVIFFAYIVFCLFSLTVQFTSELQRSVRQANESSCSKASDCMHVEGRHSFCNKQGICQCQFGFFRGNRGACMKLRCVNLAECRMAYEGAQLKELMCNHIERDCVCNIGYHLEVETQRCVLGEAGTVHWKNRTETLACDTNSDCRRGDMMGEHSRCYQGRCICDLDYYEGGNGLCQHIHCLGDFMCERYKLHPNSLCVNFKCICDGKDFILHEESQRCLFKNDHH